MSEAGVAYLRAAFRGEPVADGYEGDGLPVTPQPVQGGRLPIYMGANSEAAIDRVARLADGYLAVSNNQFSFEGLTTMWTKLKPHLEKYHRDIASFPFVGGIHL